MEGKVEFAVLKSEFHSIQKHIMIKIPIVVCGDEYSFDLRDSFKTYVVNRTNIFGLCAVPKHIQKKLTKYSADCVYDLLEEVTFCYELISLGWWV